jgi:hypothetical protein
MPALLVTMILGGCGDGDSVSVAPSTPIAKDARAYTATITAVSSGITHTLVVKVVMR